jgi:hypothetical protein
VPWPFLPDIRPELLDELKRVGQRLRQVVEAGPPNGDTPR